MPEKESENLRRELGVTRRDLLKRGAVVGGTLLWAAPVIQSIGSTAFAGTPKQHKCCFCSNPSNPRQFPNTQCINNGVPPSSGDCAAICASLGFTSSSFCESDSPTTCSAASGCTCP